MYLYMASFMLYAIEGVLPISIFSCQAYPQASKKHDTLCVRLENCALQSSFESQDE